MMAVVLFGAISLDRLGLNLLTLVVTPVVYDLVDRKVLSGDLQLANLQQELAE